MFLMVSLVNGCFYIDVLMGLVYWDNWKLGFLVFLIFDKVDMILDKMFNGENEFFRIVDKYFMIYNLDIL